MNAGAIQERMSARLDRHEEAVQDCLLTLLRDRAVERLWDRDASLWSAEPETQRLIRNRQGWLTVPEEIQGQAESLTAFAKEIRGAGFRQVVLLGMGGSSLFPEVCFQTFGSVPSCPSLLVLDTTDPATIRHAEATLSLEHTLFLVASKSGTTVEVDALYRYFRERLKKATRPSGQHSAAITDPGTPLEALARDEGFRRVFLNPSDIGGRYSALSYFGLVPLALMGVDVPAFLSRDLEMVRACRQPAPENPGLHLGAILGTLALRGRDKVTFLFPSPIARFGWWLEQLIAESTGKEGKGIVPVEGEAAGGPEAYGQDRVFVSYRLASVPDPELDDRTRSLQQAGHPVVEIPLRDTLDLAGECFRWEMATAVAGHLLGINPFDEPNVTESKVNTQRLLQEYQQMGRFPPRKPLLEEGEIHVFGAGSSSRSIHSKLTQFFEQSRPPDYLAILAYLERNETHEALLQALRTRIRDRFQIAATVGYGPRYLHSTGQLHKGGPNTGFFIQITAEDAEDLPIPGAPYSFSLLKQAQALGDYQALRDRGRRVLEIHLGRNVEEHLRMLTQWLQERI